MSTPANRHQHRATQQQDDEKRSHAKDVTALEEHRNEKSR